MTVIRSVCDDEVDTIAAIHVQSWQTAYRGIMPDELLAEQAVANREVMWRKTLAKMSGSILVSACNKDQIAGFSFCAHAQNFPEDQLYDAGFMPFTSDLI